MAGGLGAKRAVQLGRGYTIFDAVRVLLGQLRVTRATVVRACINNVSQCRQQIHLGRLVHSDQCPYF